MLDTSGAGLHKRGYRADSNDAPIKETLAAAMVDLSRVRANHFVTDPMCGSGTILIEAAMKALNIAPGLNRYLPVNIGIVFRKMFLKQQEKMQGRK